MYIAYIREGTPAKKPTRKERIQAMADHLTAKWDARNEIKAQKWFDSLDEETKKKFIT